LSPSVFSRRFSWVIDARSDESNPPERSTPKGTSAINLLRTALVKVVAAKSILDRHLNNLHIQA
jgi:hypothetical protein